MKLKIVMNKHKSNKIKENSNTVRHLIMGQITTTQNLVAIKEVRHAGQWVNSLSPWIFDKNLENITCILMQFSPSNSLQIFIESALHGLMKTFSRHWLRLWLAAWRHQAVTWANVDPRPMPPYDITRPQWVHAVEVLDSGVWAATIERVHRFIWQTLMHVTEECSWGMLLGGKLHPSFCAPLITC